METSSSFIALDRRAPKIFKSNIWIFMGVHDYIIGDSHEGPIAATYIFDQKIPKWSQ